MTQKIKITSILLAILFLGSCSQNNETSKRAKLMIFNAFQQPMSIELISEKDKTNIDLESFQASDYLELQPSQYTLRTKTTSKELLNDKLALAKNEKYTVIFYGDPELSSQVNQSNFKHTLHYIFEGSENHTKNGYLPGMTVFRDKIKVKNGYSKIRVFNAALGFAPINLKVKTSKKTQSITSGLAYAKPMLGKPISTGNKTVELFLDKSQDPVYSQQFAFENKKAYTVVVYLKYKKPQFKILENQ